MLILDVARIFTFSFGEVREILYLCENKVTDMFIESCKLIRFENEV